MKDIEKEIQKAIDDMLMEKEKEKEKEKISLLEPGGFTYTNTKLHAYARKMIRQAKELFKSTPINAEVCPYRWYGFSSLTCHLTAKGDKNLDKVILITIHVAERQSFLIPEEPVVFDMAEAVHLAGLIVRALDATVTLGFSNNETNPAVLKEGQTRCGPINL